MAAGYENVVSADLTKYYVQSMGFTPVDMLTGVKQTVFGQTITQLEPSTVMQAGLALLVIGGFGQLIANIILGKRLGALLSAGHYELKTAKTLAYLGILLTFCGLISAIIALKKAR